jgi:hypothetical protein
MNTMMNWAPNHDERSRNYPARALMAGAAPRINAEWPAGPVLNQGTDGACVGYAFGAATIGLRRVLTTPAAEAGMAERIYTIAKTLDERPGEDYTGTSVLAGAKAVQAMDMAPAYRWCFGVADVVDAICNLGPVVLGLYWTEGMRDVKADGVMAFTGRDIGGHATTAVGYYPAVAVLGGQPGILLKNSWGTSWGRNGYGWLATTDLISLLQKQGEALVLTDA